MESNLTAILNFYAYLILALDFDSFSPFGGDYYFEKAAEVVQMAQSSGEKGWKAFETMVDAGIKEESAYYESLHEVPLIANLIDRKRLYYQVCKALHLLFAFNLNTNFLNILMRYQSVKAS